MHFEREYRTRETDPEFDGVYLENPRTARATKSLVLDIMSAWKQTRDFHVMVANSGEEENDDHVQAIIYPEDWILKVSANLGRWSTPAVMGLIFHEVGHIILGHSHYESEYSARSNHFDEFQADEFAMEHIEKYYGYIPQSAALLWLNSYTRWYWDLTSFSHPCGRDRWDNLARYDFLPKDHRAELKALGMSLDTTRRLDELIGG